MAEKQLICPNCGAILDKSDINDMECPYCGGNLEEQMSEQINSSELYIVERCGSFKISENEAKQALEWELIKNCDDVPLGLFDNLRISAQRTYVPFWHFSGTMDMHWSCIKKIKDFDGSPRPTVSYVPIQGDCAQNFHIEAYASRGSQHKGNFTIKSRDGKILSQEIEKDAVVYDSYDSEFVKKSLDVKEQLDSISASMSYKYKPIDWGREEHSDFHANFGYVIKEEECVLHPMWQLTYEYKGRPYTCYCSGDKKIIERIAYPREAEDIKEKEEKSEKNALQNEIKEPININLFAKGFGILSVIVLLYIIFVSRNFYLVGVIVCAVVFFAIMCFLFENEKDLIKDCENSYDSAEDNIKHKILKNRISFLLTSNNPLFDSHRKKMEQWIADPEKKKDYPDASQLQQVISKYHRRLKRDKLVCFVFVIILFALLLLSIVLGSFKKNTANNIQEIKRTPSEINAIAPISRDTVEKSIDIPAGLTFRTFTMSEYDESNKVTYQSRLSNTEIAENLKGRGFVLSNKKTESRPDYTGEDFFDVSVETYTKTINGRVTTVILEEEYTKIIFPSLSDVEAFKKTIRVCKLCETKDGFKDPEEVYWAGTDVSIKGTTVTLSYRSEA